MARTDLDPALDDEDEDVISRPRPTGEVIQQAQLQRAPDLAPAPQVESVEAFAQGAPQASAFTPPPPTPPDPRIQEMASDPSAFAPPPVEAPRIAERRFSDARLEAQRMEQGQRAGEVQRRTEQSQQDKEVRQRISGLKQAGVQIDTDPATGQQSPKVDEQGRVIYKPKVIEAVAQSGDGTYVTRKQDSLGRVHDVPIKPKIDPATGEKYIISSDGVTRESLGVDEGFVQKQGLSQAAKLRSYQNGLLSAHKQKKAALGKQVEALESQLVGLQLDENPAPEIAAKRAAVMRQWDFKARELAGMTTGEAELQDAAMAANDDFLARKGALLGIGAKELAETAPGAAAQAAQGKAPVSVAIPQTDQPPGLMQLTSTPVFRAMDSDGKEATLRQWVNDQVAWKKANEPKFDAAAEKQFRGMHPDRPGFLGWMRELGAGIWTALVDRAPEDFARVMQGANVPLHGNSWMDQLIKEQVGDSEARGTSIQQRAGSEVSTALATGPASSFTSLATMVGGAAAGGATGAALGPLGIVGGAASGALGSAAVTYPVFYRMAQNRFLENLRDRALAGPNPPGESDWDAMVEKFSKDAAEYGHAEAAPEALSNAFTAMLFGGPGKTLLRAFGQAGVKGAARAAVASAAKRLGLELGEELATETATEMWQGKIEERVGLRDKAPTLEEAFKEVRGPTIVGTLLQAGGFSAYNKIRQARENAKMLREENADSERIARDYNEANADVEGFTPISTKDAPAVKAATNATFSEEEEKELLEAAEAVDEIAMEYRAAEGDEARQTEIRAQLAPAEARLQELEGFVTERTDDAQAAISEIKATPEAKDRAVLVAALNSAQGVPLKGSEKKALMETANNGQRYGVADGRSGVRLSDAGRAAIQASHPAVAKLLSPRVSQPSGQSSSLPTDQPQRSSAQSQAPAPSQSSDGSPTEQILRQDLQTQNTESQAQAQNRASASAPTAPAGASAPASTAQPAPAAQSRETPATAESAATPRPSSGTAGLGSSPNPAPGPAPSQAQIESLRRRQAAGESLSLLESIALNDADNAVPANSVRRAIDSSKLRKTLEGLGVKLRVTAEPRGMSASYKPNGELEFRIDEAAMTARLAKMAPENREAFLQTGIREEIVHLASLEAVRREWIAGGRKGSFEDLFVREYQKVAQELEKTKHSDGKSLAQHTRDIYGDPNLSGTQLAAEWVRQLTQTQEGNLPTEGYLRRFVEKIVSVLREMLGNKKTWSQPLQDAFDATNRVLAEAEATSAPDWLQSEASRFVAEANKLGVADEIERLSADRFTATQVVSRIPALKAMPVDGDAKAIVYAVRSDRKIPSMEERADFEAWLKRRATSQVTTAAIKESLKAQPTAETAPVSPATPAPAPTQTQKSGEVEGQSASPKPAPAKEPKQAKPKAATTNAEGQRRVRLKSAGPQTFAVLEQLPPAKGDQPGEAFFRVRNERTGDAQTVESADMIDVGAAPKEPRTFARRGPKDGFGGEQTPVSAFIIGNVGGLLSRSQAQKTGRYERTKPLWDDAPRLSDPSHNKIYSTSGVLPDEAASALYEAGLIRENEVGAMWRAISTESQSAKSATNETRQQAVEANRQEQQASDFETASKRPGGDAIQSDDLHIGDTVEIDGETLAVTGIDPDTNEVTLQDGARFGVQTVQDGEVIYGELTPKERPTDFLPPQLRPGEQAGELFQGADQPFNLSGETGVDGERVTREREQAERDAAEAKERAEKEQGKLFLPSAPRITSTAILLPDGTFVTGKTWNAPHKDFTAEAMARGADVDSLLDPTSPLRGFVVEDENGQRFVDRKEAYAIAGESGQRAMENTKGELNSQDLRESTLGLPPEQENDTLLAMRSAIAALPEIERRVLLMRIQGQTNEQIAPQVGLTPAGVEGAYKVARGKVQIARKKAVRLGSTFAAAQRERAGKRKIGRPDLANPQNNPDARRLQDAAAQNRQDRGEPGVKSDLATQDAADAHWDAVGESDIERELVTAAEKQAILTDEQTLNAKRLLRENGMRAIQGNDLDLLYRYNLLADAYLDTGTSAGRSFRQRRDAVMTPAQRLAEYLTNSILRPGPTKQKALDKARKERNKEMQERILKDLARENAALKARLRKLGVDPDNLTADAIRDLSRDPAKAEAALRAVQQAKGGSNFFDAVFEHWISGILSGPATNVANFVGNTANGAWHMLPQRFVEASLNLFVQDPKSARFSEFLPMAKSLMPALARAGRNMMVAWRTERPRFEQDVRNTEGASTVDNARRGAIPGKYGRVVRMPLRMLQAMDDFAKSLFGTLEAAAQSHRMVKTEGLTGQAAADRAEMLMLTPQEAINKYLPQVTDTAEVEARAKKYAGKDASAFADRQSDAWQEARNNEALKIAERAGYSNAAWSLAIETATDLAFQTESPASKWLIGLRETIPGLRYFIPFIRSPLNILKTGLRRFTPLGVLPLIYRSARHGMIKYGWSNAEPTYSRTQALSHFSEQLIAWGMLAALAGLAAPGDDGLPIITGTLPYRPGRRGERDLAARTAPPQSIRWGGKWMSYARIEPFASGLGVMVDALNRVFQSKAGREAQGTFNDALENATALVRDKTFLRGIGDLMMALQDENYASTWASNFATSWVPNIFRAGSRETDAMMRETGNWGKGSEFSDRYWSRLGYKALPLASRAPQPKFDLWGRWIVKDTEMTMAELKEFERTRGIAPSGDVMQRFFSPMRTQKEDFHKLDKLIVNFNNAHPNAEFAPQPPKPYFSRKGKNGKSELVGMTDKEFAAFMRISGRTAAAMLEGKPLNHQKPTEIDIEIMSDAIASARKTTKKSLWQARLAGKQ